MADVDRMALLSMALCDVSEHEAKPTMETGMPFRRGRHGRHGIYGIQVLVQYCSMNGTRRRGWLGLVYTGTPCVPLDLGSHASRR